MDPIPGISLGYLGNGLDTVEPLCRVFPFPFLGGPRLVVSSKPQILEG